MDADGQVVTADDLHLLLSDLLESHGEKSFEVLSSREIAVQLQRWQLAHLADDEPDRATGHEP